MGHGSFYLRATGLLIFVIRLTIVSDLTFAVRQRTLLVLWLMRLVTIQKSFQITRRADRQIAANAPDDDEMRHALGMPDTLHFVHNLTSILFWDAVLVHKQVNAGFVIQLFSHG